MKNNTVVAAREYAEALFALAAENGTRSDVASSLDTVDAVFSQCPDYEEVLSSAFLDFDKKEKLISEAFGEISEEVESLLLILVKKGRISLVREIAAEYAALESSASGRSDALIVSASELSDDDKRRLVDKLQKHFNKVIDATFEVDAGLIGGVVVKCGDVVLDSSIRNKLLDIKEEIRK